MYFWNIWSVLIVYFLVHETEGIKFVTANFFIFGQPIFLKAPEHVFYAKF